MYNINNDIKNNLQLFFNFLYNIDIQQEPGNKEAIILIPSLKNIINDCAKSIKLQKLIQKKEKLYKENLLKRNKTNKNKKINSIMISPIKIRTLYLFNQNYIYNPNNFFLRKNELNLLNQIIYTKIFKIIKFIFYDTFYNKNKTIKKDNNYVLAYQPLNLAKKKKKKLIKNSSVDSIFQKKRNFHIIDKALTNIDNSNNNIFFRQKKKNISLPYIEDVTHKKKGRNKKERKRNSNSLPSINFNDSMRIKYDLKEKKKRDIYNNFDYKQIFKLHKFKYK